MNNPANLESTLDRLASGERHFNTIQAGLRALASTWTLAAFGGIASLLKGGEGWLMSATFLAVLVCALGSVGLLALWILDQLVYQRLLNSIFMVGLKIEHDYPEVPPVRAVMAVASEGKGMSRWLRLFYLLPMGALTATSILLFFQAQELRLLILLICAALCGIIAWVALRSDTIAFHKRISAFGDHHLTTIAESGRYGDIVRRFGGGWGRGRSEARGGRNPRVEDSSPRADGRRRGEGRGRTDGRRPRSGQDRPSPRPSEETRSSAGSTAAQGTD